MRFYLFDVVAIIIFFLQVKLLKEHGKGGVPKYPGSAEVMPKKRLREGQKEKTSSNLWPKSYESLYYQ